jgi:hypothetical protein
VILRGTRLDTFTAVRKTVMCKYLGSIALAGCAVAASPLVASPSVSEPDKTAATVAVQQVRLPAVSGMRDEAAMVLIGTALIGLAAAVRRAA